MDYYFYLITIIDIFILSTMCVFTKLNAILDNKKKKYLMSSFILIIFISILEVITIIVDRLPVYFRIINIISNYLGFGLTPAVPICLALSLGTNQSVRYAVGYEIIYLIFLFISLPFGWVFHVNQMNVYSRGNFFGIYLFVYFVSILYLLITTLTINHKYQNRSKCMVYPIVTFLTIGAMIQVLYPQIHITWLCVTLLSVLYYIYCSELWNQLDGLTGLLNQKSYLNMTSELNGKGMLVVFDVDDFKDINDQYGHLIGDQCLIAIAECIKKAYFHDGYCYRIGGDEFCVLLKEDANPKKCYHKFMRLLDKKREIMPILPSLSIGSATFQTNFDAVKVKEIADLNMYQNKKEKKLKNKK